MMLPRAQNVHWKIHQMAASALSGWSTFLRLRVNDQMLYAFTSPAHGRCGNDPTRSADPLRHDATTPCDSPVLLTSTHHVRICVAATTASGLARLCPHHCLGIGGYDVEAR